MLQIKYGDKNKLKPERKQLISSSKWQDHISRGSHICNKIPIGLKPKIDKYVNFFFFKTLIHNHVTEKKKLKLFTIRACKVCEALMKIKKATTPTLTNSTHSYKGSQPTRSITQFNDFLMQVVVFLWKCHLKWHKHLKWTEFNLKMSMLFLMHIKLKKKERRCPGLAS